MLAKNKEKTIVVYTLEPWDHSLAYLRYRAPAEQLGWRLLQGREGSTVNLDYIREADIVLIQRVFPHWYEHYQKIIENVRMLQKPLLYEIDDLLIALPPEHPFLNSYTPTLEYILLGMMDADRVIVSSQLLAKIFAPFHDDIKVWPAYLPDSIWQPKRIQISSHDVVRVGYMGGMTHMPDLDMIAPVIQKLLDEYGNQIELHLWGCKPSIELNGNVIVHYLEEKINYLEFVDDFSSAQVDIWLGPLQDTIFNRCKSSIKYWEYAAVGGTGVFSDLEPYLSVVENQKDGFLVKTQEDWYRTIMHLISNPNLRDSTSKRARLKLERQGKMSDHLQEWEQIYLTVCRNDNQFEHSSIREALYRFIEQICKRTAEKEKDIQKLTGEIYFYTQQLDLKDQQLNAILNSRSWRLVEAIGKVRQWINRHS